MGCVRLIRLDTALGELSGDKLTTTNPLLARGVSTCVLGFVYAEHRWSSGNCCADAKNKRCEIDRCQIGHYSVDHLIALSRSHSFTSSVGGCWRRKQPKRLIE